MRGGRTIKGNFRVRKGGVKARTDDGYATAQRYLPRTRMYSSCRSVVTYPKTRQGLEII